MVECPYCGRQSREQLRTRDVNRKTTDDVFVYYECTACGLIFLSPVPPKLGVFYSNDYYGIPADLAALEKQSEVERYRLEFVQRFAQQGRLVEVGASYGAFSLLATRAGFDVTAIEMDARCCEFLREVVGVETINSDDAVSALKGIAEADVVVLWHVLEHLPKPWEMIEAISSALRAGGIALIAVPNPDALQFRILGKRWVHVDAPRHLFQIPFDWLRARCESAGLPLQEVTGNDEGGLWLNRWGWEVSLLHSVRGRYLGGAARRFGRLVSILTGPLERRVLKGATYTAAFRRSAASEAG